MMEEQSNSSKIPIRNDEQPEPAPTKPASSRNKKILTVLLVVALVLIAFAGAYLWRDKQANQESRDSQQTIAELRNRISELEAELAQPTEEDERDAEEKGATTLPSEEDLENIREAVASGNLATLESYMSSAVNVILAASECCGERTPQQAIEDMAYLEGANGAWDFVLPDSVIASYQDGSYATYFNNGSFVGRSDNKYVVSFNFDENGKINGVFMTGNEELLL